MEYKKMPQTLIFKDSLIKISKINKKVRKIFCMYKIFF